MPVKIGIDIGSSTTKIVAFEGKHMLPPMAVKADSQVASLYGAFGRYLYENNLELSVITSRIKRKSLSLAWAPEASSSK